MKLLSFDQAISRTRPMLAAALLAACAACGGGGGGGSSEPPPPVVVPPTAPTITTQALNASAQDGGTASFSVVATGTAPLTYQWQRDGNNIAGATSASFTTPALRLTDSGGQYRVVVSNAGGSVTSTAASLSVLPIALSVGTQPKASTVPDGGSATFTVAATGSEPITYQWMRGGSSLPAATSASYTVPAKLADSGGEYQVLITNPAGTVASEKVALTVTPVAPSISSHPAALTVADQGLASLSVATGGSQPQTYQWRRNGTAIAGATAASYSFNADFASNGDSYSVTISNAAGSIDSQAAAVTVDPRAASISAQPQSATANPGSGARFSVAASGTPPLSYQWQRSMDSGKNWSDIAGAVATSHTITYATLADTATRLRVRVKNPAATVSSQPADLTVTPNVRLLGGALGGSGYAEGRGTQARFFHPFGVAADKDGNTYVADSSNHVIRRVSADGQTTLFAGSPGVQGITEGARAEARLSNPSHLAMDSNGTLYFGNQCAVRKIAADGTVSTLAGSSYDCGTPADGQGGAARFAFIRGLALDQVGNIYVSDGDSSQTLRKIRPDGLVSTLAGSFGQLGMADGTGAEARFLSIGNLTMDPAGTLFVVDSNAIRTVSPTGAVSLYAGSIGIAGSAEGDRLTARFFAPAGLSFDQDGNLFITEYSRIVRIGRTGIALKAAGGTLSADGFPDSIDGTTSNAGIFGAGDVTRLPNGNLAFVEEGSHALRIITPAGVVSTLAGLKPQLGTQDGQPGGSRFRYPQGMAVTAAGTLFVADRDNNRIRRIEADGRVSTVAGSVWGSTDGAPPEARFAAPNAVALDAAGNLYVADTGNHAIRKISPIGVTTTFAGSPGFSGTEDGTGGSARFTYPLGVAVDANGNVFVADSSNHTLRKITPAGVVSTVAGMPGSMGTVDGQGDAVRFSYPGALAIDSKGNVYVVDTGLHAIRRVTPEGVVSTFAGESSSGGISDDASPFTRFNKPGALAFDAKDNLYVSDSGNNLVRRVGTDGRASTVIGVPGTARVQLGVGGSINAPAGLAVLANGRVVVASEQAILTD